MCLDGDPYCVSSSPDFEDYRRNNRTFSDMAAFSPLRVSLSGRGAARFVDGMLVSGTYFTLLGVAPSAGRFIAPSDGTSGSPLVAVMSHRMWTADFGGDDGVVGRALRLNGTSVTVIGVAPRGFHGTRLSYPDLWMPIASLALLSQGFIDEGPFGNRRGTRWIQGIIGRRHPDVTIEQARADLELVALGIGDLVERRGVTVEATRSVTLPATAAGDVTRFVSLLMAIVGVALLIACANIANLLLVRARARRSEIGVRMAVGAGRARLVRQLLVESVLLSAVGGVAGLVVAGLLVRVSSSSTR